MIGPRQYAALCFIRDNANCYAWQLANHLWRDDEPMGQGTTIFRPAGGDRGAGGNLAASLAGALNGKLGRLGLTTGYSGSMQVTPKGREAIKAYESANG